MKALKRMSLCMIGWIIVDMRLLGQRNVMHKDSFYNLMPIITQTWTEQSTVPKFRERNSNVLKLIAAEKIKQVFIVDIASETCNVSLQQHCPLEFKN